MKNTIDGTSPRSRKNTFGSFVDSVIQFYSDKAGNAIQINQISIESGVEKRRLYDLFNVFTACGVCTKNGTHSYLWKGLDKIETTLREIACETEKISMIGTPTSFFVLSDGPSIKAITKKFLMYYFYTGKNTINLRDAANLMGGDEKREKPILRRLYLVTFLLERLGIIKHSLLNAEYEFIRDLNKIINETCQKMAKTREFPPESILNLMNRVPPNIIKKLHKSRLEALSHKLIMKKSMPFLDTDVEIQKKALEAEKESIMI